MVRHMETLTKLETAVDAGGNTDECVKATAAKLSVVRKSIEVVIKTHKKMLSESKSSIPKLLEQIKKSHPDIVQGELFEGGKTIDDAMALHARMIGDLNSESKIGVTYFNYIEMANTVLQKVAEATDSYGTLRDLYLLIKEKMASAQKDAKVERFKDVASVRVQSSKWQLWGVPKKLCYWMIKKGIIDNADDIRSDYRPSIKSAVSPGFEAYDKMLVWPGFQKCADGRGHIVSVIVEI